MAKRKKILERNERIKAEVIRVQNENPKWSFDSVLQEVADKFFLEKDTIYKINNGYQ